MKNMKLLYAGIILVTLITGFIVYKVVLSPKKIEPPIPQITQTEDLSQLDSAVTVDLKKSTTKDNTMVLSISGLTEKYVSVAYELSYDTQGVMQGVTSKPLDLSGKDSFVRDDIYLGTCSRNICRPHSGVKKLSLVLEFTDTKGKMSQFSKDFDI